MQSENSQLEMRVRHLESTQGLLRGLCLFEAVALVALGAMASLTGHVHAKSSPEILRARGLVIEDSQGRPRVLLGAPFPKVPDRKRQDEGSTAIVFLGEDGSDRLIVGEGIDPQINGKVYPKGRRAVVGSDFGVSINDGEGNERGGFGFTAIPSGGGRAVIALDRPTGDAWGAWVDDKSGWAGMTFNYPMPFKQYQPAIEVGVQGDKPFLHFKDKNDNARAELSLAPDGIPSLDVFDAKGNKNGDAFQIVKK